MDGWMDGWVISFNLWSKLIKIILEVDLIGSFPSGNYLSFMESDESGEWSHSELCCYFFVLFRIYGNEFDIREFLAVVRKDWPNDFARTAPVSIEINNHCFLPFCLRNKFHQGSRFHYFLQFNRLRWDIRSTSCCNIKVAKFIQYICWLINSSWENWFIILLVRCSWCRCRCFCSRTRTWIKNRLSIVCSFKLRREQSSLSTGIHDRLLHLINKRLNHLSHWRFENFIGKSSDECWNVLSSEKLYRFVCEIIAVILKEIIFIHRKSIGNVAQILPEHFFGNFRLTHINLLNRLSVRSLLRLSRTDSTTEVVLLSVHNAASVPYPVDLFL